MIFSDLPVELASKYGWFSKNNNLITKMTMPRNSIGGALSLQIQHKTRLQLFDDFSSDDVLSAVLLSDSEDDSESLADDGNGNNDSTAMDVDDPEVESQFENIDDIASTLPMPYHNDLFSKIDLLETTIEKLKILEAPTPSTLSTTGWEKHLRKLLDGESEPAYRVCRSHGSSSRYFLKAIRRIHKWEALGVLVGRLVETKRWERQHILKRKQAKAASTIEEEEIDPDATTTAAVDEEIQDPFVQDTSSFRWEITAESLKKISNDLYTGPDLMIDLQDAANELVHLHDPFWEEEGAIFEEANTQLYTSLIKDPATGVTMPTTVLYSTCEIKAGETLTVNWDDAYWSEVSEKENLTAAATAWSSLHFPLLQLRDLALRHGIPVSMVAPYYPDEIEQYKQRKKEIEIEQKIGSGGEAAPAVVVEDSPGSPALNLEQDAAPAPEQSEQQQPAGGEEAVDMAPCPSVINLVSEEKLEEEEEVEVQQEGEAMEIEPTEVLTPWSDDENEVESINNGGGGGVSMAAAGGEGEEDDLESEAAPSIRIELDTSSHMGTFTDGKCSDEVVIYNDELGKKRRRKKKKNATKMFMDSEGSWWLNDGNCPRLLIQGAYKNCTDIRTGSRTSVRTAEIYTPVRNPTTNKKGLTPSKISLYRNQQQQTQPQIKVGKKAAPFQPFRAVSEEELSKLHYTSHCDFSNVPEPDLRKITKYAEQAHPLPASVLKSIDTGVIPKVEVTEIMSLHHPVRFLTRPDRIAYGVNVKKGCRLQPNEPLGIYVGEVWNERGYLQARGHDVDKQMYTYSMTAANLAECLGYPAEWIEKHASSKCPTFMVDAYASGNVMRFINDVYARQGNPQPNVGAEACVDPRTGLPYMLMRSSQRLEECEELMVDYGATQYWKVGGRALHRDLKRHAEVAFTAMQRLKAVLKERGVSEELIEAAAEPVDAEKLKVYERKME